MVTFKTIAEQCPTAVVGEAYLRKLISSSERRWFRATSNWLNGGDAPDKYEVIAKMLDRMDEPVRIFAQTHLDCARLLQKHWPSNTALTGELLELASNGLARGLILDLAQELRTNSPRKAIASQSVIGLLVEKNQPGSKSDQGICAKLTVELVPEGYGDLYPTPALAFVTRDEDFQNAEKHAKQYVTDEDLWKGGCDVRWSLERFDKHAIPGNLIGSSLGAAFAISLSRLFALN